MILIPCFELTTDEFNELITKTFGFSFDLKRATKMPATLEYKARKLTEADPVALLDKADSIRRGKRCNDVGLLLRILVSDGVLPSGTFHIRDGERPRVAGVWQRGKVAVEGVLTCI